MAQDCLCAFRFFHRNSYLLCRIKRSLNQNSLSHLELSAQSLGGPEPADGVECGGGSVDGGSFDNDVSDDGCCGGGDGCGRACTDGSASSCPRGQVAQPLQRVKSHTVQLFIIQSAKDVSNHRNWPYEVALAFTGLTMYPLGLVHGHTEVGSSERYDAGKDGQRCKHIEFHLSLQEKIYVNPKWKMNL